MSRLIVILYLGLTISSYGQIYPKLEKLLAKEFPEDSREDGRWVFYCEQANIQKIDKQIVKSCIPKYDFFQVTLTNYLGWHENHGKCLILYDSLKSEIILVEPLWYGGISENLFRLCIGEQFDSKDSLIKFMNEFLRLMEVGSGYKIIYTSYSDSIITYDLILKGFSKTTGDDLSNLPVQYDKNSVYRKIEIEIKDLTIRGMTSTNPKTFDKMKVK